MAHVAGPWDAGHPGDLSRVMTSEAEDKSTRDHLLFLFLCVCVCEIKWEEIETLRRKSWGELHRRE